MSADPHGGAGVEAPMSPRTRENPTAKVRAFVASSASLLFCPSGANGAKFSRTPAIDYVAMTSQPVDDL